MKQNDLALIKWIDEFAKQGYVTINRGKHLPFLFDIKIFSMEHRLVLFFFYFFDRDVIDVAISRYILRGGILWVDDTLHLSRR